MPVTQDNSRMRHTMVAQQIAARGVADARVLAAMAKTPRESFVADGYAVVAYSDSALPIAEGQSISQPYIVAVMAEAAEIAPDDRVLEVGAGSGYAAAVFAELAHEVHTVERHAGLAHEAEQRLARLGYANVEVHTADGTTGWPDAAPYDAIIVAAGGPRVPEALKRQLSIGGRLVIPVGEGRIQSLRKITRESETTYRDEGLGAVQFVPLVEG